MASLSRWIVRAGALALILWPLVPQVGVSGRTVSVVALVREANPSGTPVEGLGLLAWLFLPVASGVVLLAAVARRAEPGPALRGIVLAVLMTVAFAAATSGSLVLTHPVSGAAERPPSFPLALLHFLVPLILGGTALARLVGGDFARSSGGFARLSLGVLMILQGLFLIDTGWDQVLPLLKVPGAPQASAGAWLLPAAGLAVAAGETLARLRPRAAVDTAPASG